MLAEISHIRNMLYHETSSLEASVDAHLFIWFRQPFVKSLPRPEEAGHRP